jgi:hypothetical protein
MTPSVARVSNRVNRRSRSGRPLRAYWDGSATGGLASLPDSLVVALVITSELIDWRDRWWKPGITAYPLAVVWLRSARTCVTRASGSP